LCANERGICRAHSGETPKIWATHWAFGASFMIGGLKKHKLPRQSNDKIIFTFSPCHAAFCPFTPPHIVVILFVFNAFSRTRLWQDF
jgi:hypothetical protein